jgi:DNA-binding winged helix-turn-helix (wHTH) protein
MQFGVFEVDLQAGELRKSGLRIKLQDQPFQILVLLLEHPGEVVTREQLRQRLWPADTFVDFDHSLNSAVKKLRLALGDDPDNPRFVETIPRRGYRFIAPVHGAIPSSEQVVKDLPLATPAIGAKPRYYWLAIIVAVIVTVAALSLWNKAIRAPRAIRVVRVTQLTRDGQTKDGPMATDGSRIYFTEVLPDQRAVIMQVSIKGGECPLSLP